MFGFGSDNKEKLKENMEEIKDLIDKGERPAPEDGGMSDEQVLPDDIQEDQNAPEQQDFGQETPAEEQETGDEMPETHNFSDTPQSPEPGSTGQRGFDQEFGGPQGGSEAPSRTQEKPPEPDIDINEDPDRPHLPNPDARGAEEPGERSPPEDRPHAGQRRPQERQETPAGQQDAWQERQETPAGQQDARQEQPEPAAGAQEKARQGQSGGLDAEIPSPPETREINVPEIDKGPLFIRRQKFERAREMITEMLYQAREMEDVINHLESGLQRDRETERDIKELVQNFEGNRGQVEDIISPGEE
ncbi:MAG: hypothetical protein ABEI58_01040 [Candidatus Nanohaloarchaea archaeon]